MEFLFDEISQPGLTIKLIRHLKQFGSNIQRNPQSNLWKVFDVSLEMSGDPKKIFWFYIRRDCRAFSLFKTVTGSRDAIHEFGKFVLSKTEIIYRIA